MNDIDLKSLLKYIDSTDYDTWCRVGMALKHEGYPFTVWDEWSKSAGNYDGTERLMKKWNSFQENTGNPVTGATIVELAKKGGWNPSNAEYVSSYRPVTSYQRAEPPTRKRQQNITPFIDPTAIKADPFEEPTAEEWNYRAAIDNINFLSILFKDTDNIVICGAGGKNKNGKPTPGQGKTFNAGELKQKIAEYKTKHINSTDDEIMEILKRCCVTGTTEFYTEGGVWGTINPTDGKGRKNENIVSFQYAMIECDELTPGEQIAWYKALNLPIVTLSFSGGKSVHAIVHIDARNAEEYRERVSYMYEVCKANGLTMDEQNKNPSRMTRYPGFKRGDHKQFLIATSADSPIYEKLNCPHSYGEWKRWVERQIYLKNSNLPPIVNLDDIWDNPPPLAPELIQGVLRQCETMMIQSHSKAGKSFAMIELALAVANGAKWMGHFPCNTAKALYVNLELQPSSCFNRFMRVAEKMGLSKEQVKNVKVWNLRGNHPTIEKIRDGLPILLNGENVGLVILDPIYILEDGDENSVETIMKMMEEIANICKSTGASVVFSHHYSKGDKGSWNAMDRGSGSGAFARSVDALIDMLPLDTSECEELPSNAMGYEVTGVLRDFPSFGKINIIFDCPIHYEDTKGILDNAPGRGTWRAKQGQGRATQKGNAEGRRERLIQKVSMECEHGTPWTLNQLAEFFGVDKRTIQRDIATINESSSGIELDIKPNGQVTIIKTA